MILNLVKRPLCCTDLFIIWGVHYIRLTRSALTAAVIIVFEPLTHAPAISISTIGVDIVTATVISNADIKGSVADPGFLKEGFSFSLTKNANPV